MMTITATDAWRAVHPGAQIGLLELSEVDQPPASPQLNQRKTEVVARLRAQYAGFTRPDFLALPVMAAYERYYKRFNKTYHVQLQVESIVLKGKALPDVSPLVDAAFAAEVETFILTAGHDAAKLSEPVVIDVSGPDDLLAPMNGAPRLIRAGDMVMRDAEGVSCSILYGQDNRSPITATTRHVLYVAYVPHGVPVKAVEEHLGRLEAYVRLFASQARVEQCTILEG